MYWKNRFDVCNLIINFYLKVTMYNYPISEKVVSINIGDSGIAKNSVSIKFHM